MHLHDKILGCLIGAAAGDALGAATELLSTRQIYAVFGGPVQDFQTPPPGTLAEGRQAGQVTDAFSIPYFLCKHLLVSAGEASRAVGENALREWGKSEWFSPFAGMTTRNAVKRLNEDNTRELWSYSGHLGNKLFKSHYYALSSNGAAVKAWPPALLHPDDIDAAIDDTIELTIASHDDVISVAGACAAAAAISKALSDTAALFDIVQAAFYGARRGTEIAASRPDILTYPGPSVSARLQMAVEAGTCHPGKAMEEIRDLIGSGPSIAETVPAALGLLVGRGGDTLGALQDAVNIGDETAAIASLVGAVSGAWKGADIFPVHYLDTINRMNGFDLAALAADLETLAKNNG